MNIEVHSHIYDLGDFETSPMMLIFLFLSPNCWTLRIGEIIKQNWNINSKVYF